MLSNHLDILFKMYIFHPVICKRFLSFCISEKFLGDWCHWFLKYCLHNETHSFSFDKNSVTDQRIEQHSSFDCIAPVMVFQSNLTHMFNSFAQLSLWYSTMLMVPLSVLSGSTNYSSATKLVRMWPSNLSQFWRFLSYPYEIL